MPPTRPPSTRRAADAPPGADGAVELHLPGHTRARAVHLLQEVTRPRTGPALTRGPDGWRVAFEPGPVDRLEYRFQVERRDGSTEVVTDPANANHVHNPYGDRSVWTRPGYAPPRWVTTLPDRRGDRASADLDALGGTLHLRTWTHPDLDDAATAPLVLVHDGPAYDDEAGLGHLLDHLAGDATVPPFRAALLGTVERDRDYSASPAYAEVLLDDVVRAALPDGADPATVPLLGVGASLGGLAHLHAAVQHPGRYAALLLQSASCFLPGTDEVERGFSRFDRIAAFTTALVAEPPRDGAVPTVLTCGLVEENLANNEAVAAALASAGWPVALVPQRDAHNMTAWRDALQPHLRDLLVGLGTAA